MPLSAYQQPAISLSASQFTEALTTNQISANYNIPLFNRNALWFIRAIGLVATQQLNYELWLFNSSTNLGGTIATDNLVGIWQFGEIVVGPPGSPGWTVTPAAGGGADPLFHYYIDGNMIPYWDKDQMSRTFAPPPGAGLATEFASLHCRLVNRSAGSKSANAAGALQVTFFVATQGEQV